MPGSILLVDDEVAITQSLKRMLKNDGHSVFTANSTNNAMQILANQDMDMVISDQRMPQEQGCIFLTEVKHRFPETIRMLMSGYCDFAALSTAVNDASIDHFIQKPWENNQVKGVVNSALEQRSRKIPIKPFFTNRQHELAQELPAALDDKHIQLYFQPICHADNKQLFGAEILSRWHHTEQGIITAETFIPIIGHKGLLGSLFKQQLQELFLELGDLLKIMHLSINLPPSVLHNDANWEELLMLLRETQSNLDHLIFEITETELIFDLDTTLHRLSELRELGVKIALDDFCTGFSSLNYLRQLPVNIIKLDKAFTSSMNQNFRSSSILWSLIELAAELGIDVIAEGVESEEQAYQLEFMGCKLQQGYWHGKPMPKQTFCDRHGA